MISWNSCFCQVCPSLSGVPDLRNLSLFLALSFSLLWSPVLCLPIFFYIPSSFSFPYFSPQRLVRQTARHREDTSAQNRRVSQARDEHVVSQTATTDAKTKTNANVNITTTNNNDDNDNTNTGCPPVSPSCGQSSQESR